MRLIGFLLMALLASAAQAVTFTAAPNAAIPDNSIAGASSTIVVPATNDRVHSLRVGVRINHGRVSDLSLWLIPPGVTWAGPYTNINNGNVLTPPAGVVMLSGRNGGNNSADFGTGSNGSTVYTNFTSNIDPASPSSTAIGAGDAPYTAPALHTPDGVAVWNGLFASNPSGNWTLVAADGRNAQLGTLVSWQLEYLPPPPTTLSLGIGPANQPGQPLRPGIPGQVAGQIELQGADLAVSGLTLQAENGVQLAANFSRVALHEDLNGNGLLDVGEPEVFSGTPAGDSVSLIAAPAVSFVGPQLRYYLVVVDALPSPAALGVAIDVVAVSTPAQLLAAMPLALGYHHFGSTNTFGSAPMGGKYFHNLYAPGVTDTIHVPATPDRIAALRVGVRIAHGRLQDVDLYLLPPGVTWAGPYIITGTPPPGVIALARDLGGNSADYGTGPANGPYVHTYFSSAADPVFTATQAIGAGTPSFTAQPAYIPEGAAVWDGLYATDPAGDWTLVVCDDAIGAGNLGGTMLSWQLEYLTLPRAVIQGDADLGRALVGSPIARPFSVHNAGQRPLTVSGIATSGPQGGEFAATGLPVLPAIVAPGASLPFQITFTPAALGARNAQIDVTSDSLGQINGVTAMPITGTGVATAVQNVNVSADDGGPVTVEATILGPLNALIDVTFTYSGGAEAGPAILVGATAGTIAGDRVLGVPAGTVLRILWDAYATERHVTDSYMVTLQPELDAEPGIAGVSAPFVLQRNGGWAAHASPSQQATGVMGHVAVYDAANDRMILFGGKRGSVPTNETWVYRRDAGSWQRITPAGVTPPARQYAAAVYDAPRGRMVMFGGLAGSTRLSDTWALDLTPGAESWSLLGTGPEGRYGHSLAHDAAGQRALLHGGLGGAYLGDTWSFNLATDAWQLLGAGPARLGHAAAWDAAGSRMVIYGGQGPAGISNEVWQLSFPGLAWSLVATTGDGGARYFGTAVAAPGLLVVQSGYGPTGLTNTVVGLPLQGPNQHVWQSLPADPVASLARVQGSGVYDATRQQGVFFGGYNGSQFLTALSLLDLAGAPAWPLANTDTGPAGRWGASMVLDDANNRVILFGGRSVSAFHNDVWVLDRATPGALWQPLATSGAAPAPRQYHATAWDSVQRRMIVHGGMLSGGTRMADLWTLDMTNPALGVWQLHALSGPPVRIRHAMVYDSNQGRAVIQGGAGSAFFNDTWAYEFGAATWAQLLPAGSLPKARYGHGAMYDAARNRMVIFAGTTHYEGLNDVWALDLAPAGLWADISALSGALPPGRGMFAHGHNAAGTQAWLFAGARNHQEIAIHDTWGLDVSGATAAWTQLALGGGPQGRVHHAGCFDGSRFVAGFGLIDGRGVRDLHELDVSNPAAAWAPLALGAGPAAAVHAMSAFDPVNRRLIVFGGLTEGALDGSTWALDLASPIATWQRLNISGPSPRRHGSMVYDPLGNRMILFGGRTGSADSTVVAETWALSLNLGSEAWVQLATTGTVTPRSHHVAVVDGTGRMIVYSGRLASGANTNSIETLQLGSLAWGAITATNVVPTRIAAAAVFDPVGNRMIVYGGHAGGALGHFEALSLSGPATWTTLARTGQAPGGLYYHSMVYDGAKHRLVLFGGTNGNAAQNRLFTVDLASMNWTEVQPPIARPQTRWAHAAVWDSTGARMAIAGGYIDGEVPSVDSQGAADAWFWGD